MLNKIWSQKVCWEFPQKYRICMMSPSFFSKKRTKKQNTAIIGLVSISIDANTNANLNRNANLNANGPPQTFNDNG